MSKIKDINERLKKTPSEFSEIRLLVAKRTLAFFIAFHFLSLLFTIGGFSFGPFLLSTLAQINFHAYSLLVIVIGWFIYELSVYASQIYFDGKNWLPMLALVGSILFVL